MMDSRKYLAAEEASVRCFRPRYFARSFSVGSFASAKVTLASRCGFPETECQPSCCNLDGF
mgnify:CR=1 FL=1